MRMARRRWTLRLDQMMTHPTWSRPGHYLVLHSARDIMDGGRRQFFGRAQGKQWSRCGRFLLLTIKAN